MGTITISFGEDPKDDFVVDVEGLPKQDLRPLLMDAPGSTEVGQASQGLYDLQFLVRKDDENRSHEQDYSRSRLSLLRHVSRQESRRRARLQAIQD